MTRSDHVDVLVVGAGLSGIGAACHLESECPGRTYAILEARDSIGGTWDLFRYPGIRSDSDMHTLGYSFKPWEDAQAIADGPAILRYINETAREHGVDQRIRFGHKFLAASWSSEEALWTVRAERVHGGDVVELTCRFLYTCTGYYDYDQGYSPRFDGSERFRGRIVHPQHWPDDLDYDGKRVVVIGSGATAVTLVPAMAERAAHVTMLQRSPSYVLTLPGRDPIAAALRRVLPAQAAYSLIRWKNVLVQLAFFNLSRRAPGLVRRLIRKGVRERLPADYDVDTHFSPSYDPWDQRVCLVPGGDIFKAIANGSADVVTDSIDAFTESGIRLASGRELEADVIITATGLNLSIMGGATLTVDGRDIDFADTLGYKGMMFSGVPNMAMAVGYTNASFTLKCELVSRYVCRLLNHMDANGYEVATPIDPGPSVPRLPFIDLQSGYVLRSIESMPKQGDASPWRLHQNYFRDLRLLKHGPIDDAIIFTRRGESGGAADAADAREQLAA